MPACSPWSASRPHSPPDSETPAIRSPRGQRRRPSNSSVSSSSWKSPTSSAPWWRSRAENARAEPTTAPECASAARAAACERPTLRQTTGLPASAARASAAANAAGRRIVSTNRPIDLRALVGCQEGDEVGQVARELATGRDHRAKADARPGREAGLRDRARMRDDGDVPWHERLGACDGADPLREPAGRRDAHAVRAHDGDVVLGRARRHAGRDLAALGSRLGAQPRQHDRAHAGRDDVLERRLRTRVPDEQEGALGRLGQRGQRREALAAEHGRPVRVDEPGRDAAAHDLLEVCRAVGRAVARADDCDRAGKQQWADSTAQEGGAHGTSAPIQVSASSGSSPP